MVNAVKTTIWTFGQTWSMSKTKIYPSFPSLVWRELLPKNPYPINEEREMCEYECVQMRLSHLRFICNVEDE